jgi:PAS domain S-box-containing protein
MKDERKTKKQLVAELTELRQRLTEATQRLGELEASEAKLKQVERELRLYSEKLKDLVEDKARILQESGENFRSLADNAGDGIFISVGEGTHVYANRRAAEMTGYSVAELLNITVEDLMSPDERQRVVTRHRKRLAGEDVPSRYETAIVRKDGVSVPVELAAARTVWHAQPAVMAIMRDITERVRGEATRARAEEALRESEAKFRTLAEQSPNMIFIYRRGKVVYANQHCAEVTGYEREEFYAPDFDFMDLIAPEHRELIRSNLARHMRGGDVEPYEYRLLTKEGEPVDVIITTKLIDYEGEAAIFGIVTDITERKRAEVALESERDKLQALMDGLARAEIGIDVVGIDYRILFQNQTLKEEFGNLAGELCYEKYGGRKEPCDFCPMVEAVKSGKVVGAELTGADGRRYELLSAPLPDPDGTVDKALEVVKDVTERKQSEEALQQHAREIAILNALGHQISASLSLEEVTTIALEEIVKTTTPDLAVLYLRRGDKLLLQGIHPDRPEFHGAEVVPKQVGQCLCGLAASEGKPVYSRNIHTDPRCTLNECGEAGFRSFAALPLLGDDGVLGVLGLASVVEEDFSAQAGFLETLASQIAIALRNAFLHREVLRHADELEERVTERTAELERRTMQLQTAAEVARDATTAHDLSSLLERAVNLVRERFGFYYAGIFLVDAQGEYAVLRAATGEAGRQMIESRHKLKVGETGIVGHATDSGKPHIALDVGSDAAHFKNPFLPDTRSETALPLQVGGRVIGALDVQSTQEAAFGEDDIATLQIMADQLAVAIERTRLFEQVQVALEERLGVVISNAPIVLFVIDRNGIFTLSEGKGLEALGVKPGDHVGKSIFDVYSESPHILEEVRRALAGETVAPIVDIGGVLFETWYTPLRDENSEITGVIGVGTDVTERLHLEAQVRQQERLAAIGQLAGGIAHDFNNYLTTIMLYAQILSNAPDLPPDLASDAQTIVDESRGAARLVQQILDFSRRSMMEAVPVDLVSFVEEVTSILRRTLPENIRLLIEVGVDNLLVKADPTRIQQVVMNLALNARDAMPEGGELCIKLSRVRTGSCKEPPAVEALPPDIPDGEWVCMTISDTGTGMTEEVQSHLFEPFFTTKGTQGTGLGLAQVHGIVKQHDGYIGVKTEAGEGTTFCICLPAHEVETKIVVETTLALPTGEGETILLVEDEERVREAIHEMLEMLGYHVLIAANGLEALEAYQSAAKVDLVLTDVVMPEMGGMELMQELQRKDPGLKALALTGYTLAKDMELHTAGFSEVVPKPVEMHVLAEAVHRVLGKNAR